MQHYARRKKYPSAKLNSSVPECLPAVLNGTIRTRNSMNWSSAHADTMLGEKYQPCPCYLFILVLSKRRSCFEQILTFIS